MLFRSGWKFGWLAALATTICLPLLGYVAVRFFEEMEKTLGATRALLFFFTRGYFAKRLLAERRAIRDEILALGEAQKK